MQITIFGATGLVGKELVAQALERNVAVKVLARNAAKLEDVQGRIEIIEGNYFDTDKLSEAIAGSQAVLSTIGPQPKASADQTTEMYTASLEAIFAAMRVNQISRFINILGAATSIPGDKPQLQRKLMRLVMGLIAKHLRETKQAEYQVISQSDAAWTSIRPGMITQVDGEFKAELNNLVNFKVDVAQLAAFMLDNIESDEWVGKSPLVATK